MRTVSHPFHQLDYDAGYRDMKEVIAYYGFAKSRDSFNRSYPTGWKPANLGVYYYSTGELDALVAAKPD